MEGRGLVRPGFRKKKTFRRAARARRYDLVVHLSEQPRGAWLARALGARFSVAPAMRGRGAVLGEELHASLSARAQGRHQVEVNLDALRRIGLQPGIERAQGACSFPAPPPKARVDASCSMDEPFIHVHPASRWRFKCWPARAQRRADRSPGADGHRVVLTAAPDPDELALVDEILGKAKSKPLNLAGKLSIKELGALTARARLFVGVDSMPMHLAAAMGTPTVALFGPSGELEWGPWNVAQRVVTSAHSCRPCGARRLRRRQGERVPDHAAGGRRCTPRRSELLAQSAARV